MVENKTTVFYNCRLLRHYDLVCDELWIRGGVIVSPVEVNGKADEFVDCHNCIISPGFIDLQVNGAYGVDFLTCPDLKEGLEEVKTQLPAAGVTSYCPTLITSPPDYFHRTLPRIPLTLDDPNCDGARVIGVHVEGPFISVQKKGAHPPECIVGFGDGNPEVVEKMYGPAMDRIKIITMAPEHAHSEAIIKHLVDRDIVVSLGHSTTDLETAERAVKVGASMITHLFNAMPAFHHRDPSLPGLLASSEIYPKIVHFGIISDGIHTNQAALRIAHRMSPKGLVLVTDAVGPMGLPPGDYYLGKQLITVSDTTPKVATVKGTDTLCGCVETMDHCIRHFKEVVGCSTPYALAAATLHPALCVKMENKIGTLEPGTFADFVLLNDDLFIQRTYVGGRVVYDRKTKQ